MVPRFLLGHNALIGVNHRDRTEARVKTHLNDGDRLLLEAAAADGLAGIVLDNHPVAIEAAHFLELHHPTVSVFPMVPYAQQVVESASREGLVGIIHGMATTSLSLSPRALAKVAADLFTGQLTRAGAQVAMSHYLRRFPKRPHPVIFLHNAVTDLLLAWRATEALSAFAAAARSRNSQPGFATLNPGRLPELVATAGDDAWFMCAVNSAGIQMSPNREQSEHSLMDPKLNVVAMSVLGGGLLDPEIEIPRAFRFPAVKSIVIGTGRIENLRVVRRFAESAAARA